MFVITERFYLIGNGVSPTSLLGIEINVHSVTDRPTAIKISTKRRMKGMVDLYSFAIALNFHPLIKCSEKSLIKTMLKKPFHFSILFAIKGLIVYVVCGVV